MCTIIRGTSTTIKLKISNTDLDYGQLYELRLKQGRRKIIIPQERLTLDYCNKIALCNLTGKETSSLDAGRYLEVVLLRVYRRNFIKDYPKVVCSMDYVVKNENA